MSCALIEFSIAKARKAQELMAQKIIRQDLPQRKVRLVAGIDVTYKGTKGIGAIAVFDYKSLECLEVQTAIGQVRVPYVSTLLAFREMPIIMAAIRKVKLQPDVFLIDGHGVAHPYKCGLASHLGLVLSKPTIGVAKNKLCGIIKKIGQEMFLVQNDEIVGAVITMKSNSKPIYVSIGHMVSLVTAIKIAKHCIKNSRIPEPIALAHRKAGEEKIRILNEN